MATSVASRSVDIVSKCKHGLVSFGFVTIEKVRAQ